MTRPNALLNALSIFVEYDSDGKMTGRCRQLPGFVIHGEGVSNEQMFRGLRLEVNRRLELGAVPVFNGTGEKVFDCGFLDSKTEQLFLLSIEDSWCGLPEDRLLKRAQKAAGEWVAKVGPKIFQNDRVIRVTCKSLAARICKAVKAGRKKYDQDKAAWEKTWEQAKLKRQEELRQDALMKEMVEQLVDEALRYVELGGRLRVPWAIRGRQSTPAETWHLMNPEAFNKRAEPPKQHRIEKKDAEGNVIGESVYCDNPGGGEMMSVGEQAEFMIGGLAKYAEEGDENALRWLHRLALRATSLFWSSVELQTALAKRVSKEWSHVPVASNGSAASAKAAEARVASLNMPEPPTSNLKVDPTTRHHAFIVRIGDAINFLMQTPPASTPWTGVDEHAPEWLKTAWDASQAQPQKMDLMPEIYWQVYEAAMTRTPESQWRKQSRPRKEREKFLKAVRARMRRSAAAKTP